MVSLIVYICISMQCMHVCRKAFHVLNVSQTSGARTGHIISKPLERVLVTGSVNLWSACCSLRNHTHAHIHAHTHTQTRTHTRTRAHTYTHAHTHIHTRTGTRTHTHTFSNMPVWRACKAHSRVQWYPKTAPCRVQCAYIVFSAGRIYEPE